MKVSEISDSLKNANGNKVLYLKDLERLYNENVTVKSILGVDLYKYSEMGKLKQMVVPSMLSEVIEVVQSNLINTESLFFSESELYDIKNSRVDTGDGFYMFFDTPLKALIYLVVFATTIQTILVGRQAPLLIATFEDFVFRYTITTGDIYRIGEGRYGDAIIRCSRILSLDKLNRFLMDRESYYWFLKNGLGFETMRLHHQKDIEKYKNTTLNTNGTSATFPAEPFDSLIETAIAQKIGMKTRKFKSEVQRLWFFGKVNLLWCSV